MRRDELARELAENAGVSPAEANRVLDALKRIAYREARNGFRIPGIGALGVRREPGQTIQPRTGGNPIEVAARNVATLNLAMLADWAIRDGFVPSTDHPHPTVAAPAPPEETFRDWRRAWEVFAKAVAARGGRIVDATDAAGDMRDGIRGMESWLPEDFVAFVHSGHAALSLHWQLPKDVEFPEGCYCPSGSFAFELRHMEERMREIADAFESEREYLAEELPEERIAELRGRSWVPIVHVDNGDCICLDVDRDTKAAAVVYLDHELGYNPLFGHRLGSSFTEFMSNWSKVGFAGPESWYLRSFLDYREGRIDSRCENAVRWRRWLFE